MSEITMLGKTIMGVSYANTTYKGFSILFTDGTVLKIAERMQVGEIVVTYNGNELQDDGEDNYD